MEELLKKYLENYPYYDIITIRYYSISGSACFVSFYTDKDEMYIETQTVTIWDMLIFLNNSNNE